MKEILSKLTFERGGERHLKDLIALDNMAPKHPHRVEQIRRWVAKDDCLVALLGSQVVGYAVMTYHFYECGFVEMLQVSPEFRRQGIGEALMRQLRSECKTQRLFISTNLSNHPMQRLLAKLGYTLDTVIHHLEPGDPELLYVHYR